MVFNSVDYLLFFPIIAILNLIIPKRFRYIFLCIASILFYLICDLKSLPVIIGEALFVYFTGLFMAYGQKKNNALLCSKLFVFVTASVLSGVLVAYKYFIKSGFPLGMSFFTLMAIGYLADVQSKKTAPEKNPIKMLLYIMFFPIVSSGPIERTGNLLAQIRSGADADLCRIKRGLLEISWGLFMKLVLSNRIAPLTDAIYDGYESYRGIEIIIATVLFGIQIYCDFAGYSYMAIGSARVLGFDLVDNFDAPYLSISPAQFWRRWHMSLYNWLREYIYFPLGGSRKGNIRKYLNTMIVFTISGIWHGNKLGFIFWGMLNGLYVVTESIINNLKRSKGTGVLQKPDHDSKAKSYAKSVGGMVFTFILIDFAWLFFKADSLSQGLGMTKAMVTNMGLSAISFADILREFGGAAQIVTLAVGIVILLAFDIMKNRYKDMASYIFTRPTAIRWAVYLGLLALIIIFGVYGYSYEQTEFIYFQF